MSRLPQKVRDALRERAEGCCELCGVPANNAHHRKNRSQGGRNELSNLLLLCGSGTTGDHGYITENPADSYANGWSVPSFRDPHVTPVRLHDGWYLLGDNGDKVQIPDRKVA
jgi:hypothetical protein